MPFPETLKDKPKCIFFTDFDGTITLQDTNDWMTDNLGFGPALRKKGNEDTLNGTRTFRETFQEMINSIRTPFPQCISLLRQNIALDPHFQTFYTWARAAHVPVIVLSSGMTPIIRALLVQLLGPDAEDIEIVCNEVVDRPPRTKEQEGGWNIRFHDHSGFGHDKSLTIRPYAEYFKQHPAERPTMFYAGDGVSDLSAARETDLLFAKKGRDLVTYCEREGVPFTMFEDWGSILETTKRIYEGKVSVKDVSLTG